MNVDSIAMAKLQSACEDQCAVYRIPAQAVQQLQDMSWRTQAERMRLPADVVVKARQEWERKQKEQRIFKWGSA